MKLQTHAAGMSLGVLYGFWILVIGLVALTTGAQMEIYELYQSFFFLAELSGVGIVIGALEGFVWGYVMGYVLAAAYNKFVK